MIAITRCPVAGGGWVATFEDVSEQRRGAAKLIPMAHHDALTGLANRVLFREQLQFALTRERRGSGLAVFCLDLDRFKCVNDMLGHSGGDALLRAVSAWLLSRHSFDGGIRKIPHDLRARGVRIAVDDFGTGYSSLSYLRRFPFDKRKIDQSCVREMSANDECAAIIRAVVGLGRALGIAINAEGVEMKQQRGSLCAEGCSKVQGYLLSKPRPACDIPGLLVHHRKQAFYETENV